MYIYFKFKNKKINIEVNCNSTIETLKRNIDYAYRLFVKELKSGSKYNFTQVIQINLNNFSFKNNDKVIDIYYIQNDEKEMLTNNLIFIQISVPSLKKKWYTKGIEKLEEVERFILRLVETNIDSAKYIGMEDDFMQESINDQVEFGLSEDLRESYDHELAWKEEWKRQGLFEGLEQGLEKGLYSPFKPLTKSVFKLACQRLFYFKKKLHILQFFCLIRILN